MRFVGRLLSVVFYPFRAAVAGLAAAPVPLSHALGLGRTTAAPWCRRLVRAAVITMGFAIYAGMQYGMASLISQFWWWYIVAFFIIVGCIVLAAAHPIIAFILWVVIAPFGKPFLGLDFGWTAMPALTFDFVAVYALAIMLAVRSLLNRAPPRRLILPEWFLLGYVAYASIGLILRESAFSTIIRVIIRILVPDLLLGVVLYFVCKAVIGKKEHIRWLAWSLCFFGVLMAIVAFYEHFTGNRWYSLIIGFGIPLKWTDVGKGRASGVFEHVAAPATLIATSFFLTYYLALWTKRSPARLFYLASMLLMVVGAYFTYTRNVYIALVAFALLVPLLTEGKRKQFAGLVLFGLASIVIATPRLMLDPQFAQRMLNPRNVYGRLTIAKTTINVIKHNPWFGVGFGKLSEAQRDYVASYAHWQRTRGGLGNPNTSHSAYLTMIAEEGAVGSLFYYGAILAFLVRLVRIRGRLPDDEFLGKDFVSLMIISSIVFMISIVTESLYAVPYVTYIFWIQFAMVIRLDDLRRDEETARSLSSGNALPVSEATAA